MINAQWLKRISTSCSCALCAVELRESQLKSKDLHESSLFTLKIIYIKSYFRSFIIRPSFTFYCCCKKREEEKKNFSVRWKCERRKGKSFPSPCMKASHSVVCWNCPRKQHDVALSWKILWRLAFAQKFVISLDEWVNDSESSLWEMMTMMRRELLKAMIFEFYYWFKIFLKIFSLLTHC